MLLVEALLENKKIRKLIDKAYKNCAWKWWTDENARKYISSPTFDSYLDSLFNNDISKALDDDNFESLNCKLHNVFNVSGIGYWSKDTWPKWNPYRWETIFEDFQKKLNKRIRKNLQKEFGINLKKYKNEVAADIFSGMISEYYEQWQFMELAEVFYGYKFNTSGFNFQRNFDLAWKIANNTLSIADKAEAIILFNDIKERLIAA
jgi:hypothetical protein